MPFFDKVKATFTSAPTGAAHSRNELMVEEVRKFAQEIKAFHAQYLELSKETQARISLVSQILDKPLPRVFANGHNGAYADEPVRRIGLNVASANIDKAKIELETRLHEDVMTNLDKWIADYREIKAQHRENIRLLGMVNDQRKTAASLNEKYQKQAQTHHKDTEATHIKAMSEERKYQDFQQQYIQREQEIYDKLVQLIKRSALFKDGIAMSFRIFQGAFSTGYQAFEDAHAAEGNAAPLPNQAAYHVNEPEEYKQVASMRPALPAPTDHVNGVPTPDYTRTQAGHDDNPFARGPTGAAASPDGYNPRPADPYAPTQYGAAPTMARYGAEQSAGGYGAPTAYGAPSGGGAAPAAYGSAGGAADHAAPGGYPSMYSGAAPAPAASGYGAPTPVAAPAAPAVPAGPAAAAAAPSAQEKGSTAWVEGTQPAATQA